MNIENYKNEIIEELEKIEEVYEIDNVFISTKIIDSGMPVNEIMLTVIPTFDLEQDFLVSAQLLHTDDIEEQLENIIDTLSSEIYKQLTYIRE